MYVEKTNFPGSSSFVVFKLEISEFILKPTPDPSIFFITFELYKKAKFIIWLSRNHLLQNKPPSLVVVESVSIYSLLLYKLS